MQQTGPPQFLRNMPEGIFDFNITLNFAPQMRKEYLDFLHQTRDMILSQAFDVQWYAVGGGGLLLGIFLSTCIACLIAAWGRRAPAARVAAACLVAALMLAMPAASHAQRRPDAGGEPMVDLTTLGYVPKNIGSRINGAGCCVFASQTASFVSQYREDFADYMKWVGTNLPGGGYPSRVTEYMESYCRAKNIAIPDYTQIVGDDSIAAIREALEDGRSPAVTYSGDPAFYGGPVPHMVNCVYLDETRAAIVDNNRPNEVEWMSRDVFIKRHRHFDRGWAIVYHGKPQVPRPVNARGPRPVQRVAGNGGPSYFRLAGLWDGDSALTINRIQCPTCPPQRFVTRDPDPVPQGNSSGYWWHGEELRKDGVTVGKLIGGKYHVLCGDGSRSWYEPRDCPVYLPNESRSTTRVTGVDYSHIPTPAPGRTMYGTASSDLRYDDAGRTLFQTRMTGDRAKPRIIINIDGADELVEAILRRLAALDRVFVYAREAIEVIRRLGYGPGITVVSDTTRGEAMEVAYFASVPSDADLAQALMRADPSYRPGSSGVSGGSGLDAPAMTLIVVIGLLATSILFLVSRKGANSDA